CTVGEQDPTKTIAIQDLFNTSYHRGAAPITAGRAIKFTTDSVITYINEPVAADPLRLNLSFQPSLVRQNALIRLSIGQPARVNLAIFDLSGRLVRTVANAEFEKGDHLLSWNRTDDTGRRVSAGVYVIRIETADRIVSRKAVLID
ncbi:MAG: FlgD immunoglobulin-like domain containing protein, partial [candidate division WOR-3 bacterium]